MLDARDGAAPVEVDRHQVDPERLGQIGVIHRVRLGEGAEAALLADAERFDGTAGGARAPQLDLDEDERRSAAHAVDGDEVDLTLAAADVPIDDAIAALLEVADGETLAGVTEAASGIAGRPAALAGGHSGQRTAARTGAKERRWMVL